jgi:hypothetical protein
LPRGERLRQQCFTYFEPIPPRLARNTIIEGTFDVGRRFRYRMRVDCDQLDPDTIIRLVPANGIRVSRVASIGKSLPTGAPVTTQYINALG